MKTAAFTTKTGELTYVNSKYISARTRKLALWSDPFKRNGQGQLASVTDTFIVIRALKSGSDYPMIMLTNGSVVGWASAKFLTLVKK